MGIKFDCNLRLKVDIILYSDDAGDDLITGGF